MPEASSRKPTIWRRFTLTPRSAIARARIMARTACSFPPHRVVIMAMASSVTV